jgi:prepilin-type processing-associated H-X9-DG protein/prepilin-type N-terminal cleavage/methylation domain-containing protein
MKGLPNRGNLLGVTLVELLVVIAVILVLAVIAVPSAQGWIARSQSAACLLNLRQIGTALQLYLADHENRMPVMAAIRLSKDTPDPAMDTVLLPYAGNDPRLFACPSDTRLAKVSGTSYHWNNALNGQNLNDLNFMGVFREKTRIPVIADKEGWHNHSEYKVNFLYADGHATKEFSLFTLP